MRGSTLSGCEKVAVLLLTLSRSSAASVMSAMSEEEVVNVARAMSRLNRVGGEEADSILHEFISEMNALAKGFASGASTTSDILGSFLSNDQLKSVLEKIGSSIWATLGSVDTVVFAKYLAKEHPQTSAFILSKLPPEYMGRIIAELEESLASELVGRIAELGPVSKEMEEQVEKCLKVDLVGGIAKPALNGEAARQFSKMLRGLKPSERDKYFQLLSEKNLAFSEIVQEMMLTLEDLLLITPSDFGLLLAELDQSDLICALRGAPKKVQEFFFANMPKSMSQVIKQEWEMIKKVKSKEVKAAEKKILKAVEGLLEKGKITLDAVDESYGQN